MVHIGKKVQEVLNAKGISITYFARKINKSRSVVYNIFERESIDSLLLYKISEELDFNFFELYVTNEVKNKESPTKLPSFYGDGWKIKYINLLEKYNSLLENKVEDYFKWKG